MLQLRDSQHPRILGVAVHQFNAVLALVSGRKIIRPIRVKHAPGERRGLLREPCARHRHIPKICGAAKIRVLLVHAPAQIRLTAVNRLIKIRVIRVGGAAERNKPTVQALVKVGVPLVVARLKHGRTLIGGLAKIGVAPVAAATQVHITPVGIPRKVRTHQVGAPAQVRLPAVHAITQHNRLVVG